MSSLSEIFSEFFKTNNAATSHLSKILDGLATSPDLDWRDSIVDLMKLFRIDSSLSNRETLARDLGFKDDFSDTATMNIFLQKRMIFTIVENHAVDVVEILDRLAREKSEKLDWRNSVVDLMKLFDLDHSLADRKKLARELDYTGNFGVAAMNMSLHTRLMIKIVDNGGELPDIAPTISKILPTGILPYASEPFGVYQPLIGWRSALHQEDLAVATSQRLVRAAFLLGDSVPLTVEAPIGTIPNAAALRDRTGTAIGRQLALRASSNATSTSKDELKSLLTDTTTDSPLATMTREVVAGLQQQQPGRTVATDTSGGTLSAGHPIMREFATATLLQYLVKASPETINQMFRSKLEPWRRALASVEWFSRTAPEQEAFLSPIGVLHLFREYFFELGTFLGPPVGHVWLSPGGTVELVEVNTRRTLVERTVEESTETVNKTELSETRQDELSDAVKIENASDTKLGITATASGSFASIYQASASASFNLQNSRKQAQEQTHKQMREQSSKLSSEVRQNYKTTFRTVTETTDTSSRRYVMQNTTNRLVSYELSRKMRKVAVQVQDLGQQLCWQLYIDKPGDNLGLGEFVHTTSTALDPGTKRPDKQPYPATQPKTHHLEIPFLLSQGPDDDAEFTYEPHPRNQDRGLNEETFGNDNIIQFRFTLNLEQAAPGFKIVGLTVIDFHGAAVSFTTDPAALGIPENPEPAKDPKPEAAGQPAEAGHPDRLHIRLTHANFGGKKALPFDAIITYEPTEATKNDIDAENVKLQKQYDEEVAIKKEQLFYETLRKRLKLVGQVKPRLQDDLREEERNIITRAIISRLYGNESGWRDHDYHVASEMIRYLFDIDAMLYFVAPDWWRPRSQPLASKDDKGNLQPTIIAEPAISERVLQIGTHRPIVIAGRRPYYLITEETAPAPQGASLGWLIQLDGDTRRNAFLNSPWVKAALPIRPGRESMAIAWLERAEVAGTDGLDEPYPFVLKEDPPEYEGKTLKEVLLMIAEGISKEFKESITPVPVDPAAVNSKLVLPTETVFHNGFDPLEGGINFGAKPFKVFSEWLEILPTDQVVATEYSLTGL